MIDPNELLVKSVKADLTENELVQLEFARTNAGAFMLTIEQAVGSLFEKQGQNSYAVFPLGPKTATALRGSIVDGEPVLSFVLDTKIRFDVSLAGIELHDLVECLEWMKTNLGK